ncbi:sensor histidine kinase [Facklamia sp. P12945]|uniref:sensor histidine kinase n=1 Tax=unclassified Facklamia TaxID=2622293 RepID=UPI003D166414
MNLRLWIRILLNQLIITLLICFFVVGLCAWQLPAFNIEDLFIIKIWDVRLFIWVVAIIIAFSVIYSLYLTFSLNDSYELIRAKINWLLLGKYHHPIFNKTNRKSSLYTQDYSLAQDINRLRNRLVDLTEDLQEFTAAPVFVGEETKEEIIEHERSRIARELHDSVSQQLFAAMMMLSAITESYPEEENPKLSAKLEKIESVIGNAQTEMRALLLHLRPVDLQGKSLQQGINNLLLELQAKIPLELTWELDDPRLETGIEDHLFRIIQEAVSNTMRHARANKLDVYLRETMDMINIRIVDDGRGFDPVQSKKSGSYGLTNIQERVKGMGGAVSIISSPGQGTVVDIKLPYKLKK